MSPRAPLPPRPLHREPLVVALVLLNIGLGAIVLRRKLSVREALPPGHPDVSVPPAIPADKALPPGHLDVPPLAPDLAAIERAADRGPSASDFAISGTVKVSDKLKEPWPAGAAVFVIARAEGGGPPFAVRRYDGIKAPFKFSLGPDNEMLGGSAPNRLTVSVRVDQDGDAMTRLLGDLEGGPSAAVGPRGSVDVTVDRPAQLAPAR